MLYGFDVPTDLATTSCTPQCFEHCAHRTTRNDTSTRRSCTQQDLAGAMATSNVVMQGAALTKRHTNHIAFGSVRCLANSLRHFTCLAVTKAYAAFLVTNDDERGETETTATFKPL